MRYAGSMKTHVAALAASLILLLASAAVAEPELKPGDPAPLFTAKTHTGADFDLAARKGQWTVLYFYPKAGTPGCTKQADSFRDSIEVIRAAGADVYGVSTDTVEDQAEFHAAEHLDFTLLADPDGKVTTAYGAKMPLVTMAKRWTFIIGPDLRIRDVDRDIDPSQDATRVAAVIARLKSAAP
jgi:peroxiredoxin Q/BCP